MAGQINTASLTILMIAASLALGGCAREEQIKTAAELYQEAVVLEESGDDVAAAEKYAELQASHPFGSYAQQAQLNLASMYFSQDDYDLALEASARFLADYPNHRNSDYALYIQSLALMRSKPSILTRVLGIETYRQSQGSLRLAHASFTRLIEEYPTTSYASDAAFRLRYIVNELARSELESALYYMRVKAYSAAVRRAAHLLSSYPDSTSGEAALAIMAACLRDIGSDAAADDALQSLLDSFPDSELIAASSNGSVALTEAMELTKPGDFFTRALER